jgi:hypothetical protein
MYWDDNPDKLTFSNIWMKQNILLTRPQWGTLPRHARRSEPPPLSGDGPRIKRSNGVIGLPTGMFENRLSWWKPSIQPALISINTQFMKLSRFTITPGAAFQNRFTVPRKYDIWAHRFRKSSSHPNKFLPGI